MFRVAIVVTIVDSVVAVVFDIVMTLLFYCCRTPVVSVIVFLLL